jgi:hypothetical protein
MSDGPQFIDWQQPRRRGGRYDTNRERMEAFEWSIADKVEWKRRKYEEKRRQQMTRDFFLVAVTAAVTWVLAYYHFRAAGF